MNENLFNKNLPFIHKNDFRGFAEGDIVKAFTYFWPYLK